MSTRALPIRGGAIEIATLPGGSGTPLVVLGGVETGLRPLAGTESVLRRRWEARTAARTVHVVGRPLPDDPTDAEGHASACQGDILIPELEEKLETWRSRYKAFAAKTLPTLRHHLHMAENLQAALAK